MNTITSTPEKAPIAPSGVFHGVVICTLGKSRSHHIHADVDFGQVGASLLNAAIAFLAKQTGQEAAEVVAGPGFVSGTAAQGITVHATMQHASWPQEWALMGYADPKNSGPHALGNFEHFDRLLDSVRSTQGEALVERAKRRAALSIETCLGFYPLPRT